MEQLGTLLGLITWSLLAATLAAFGLLVGQSFRLAWVWVDYKIAERREARLLLGDMVKKNERNRR
jgi:hypothetical protein